MTFILCYSKIKHNKNIKKNKCGHFFRYLINPSIQELAKSYLERLQIFESLNNC